jgi:hypothetical protein
MSSHFEHFDPFQVPVPSGPQVESLSLPELMRNPHVQTMYNNWKDASAQVVQGAQMQQSLWTENKRLTDEVTALQEKQHQAL